MLKSLVASCAFAVSVTPAVAQDKVYTPIKVTVQETDTQVILKIAPETSLIAATAIASGNGLLLVEKGVPADARICPLFTKSVQAQIRNQGTELNRIYDKSDLEDAGISSKKLAQNRCARVS